MKVKLISVLLVFIVTDAFSQRRVLGLVLDEFNEPLIGASIQEVGSRYGVVANFDGEFTFTTSRDSAELRISFLGYYDEIIKITSDSIVTIRLRPDSEVLSCHPIFIGSRQVRSIEVNYDIANAMFGFSFEGNQVLQRFRPRSFEYGISTQTNFNRDYGFGGSIGLRNPIRQRIGQEWRLDILSLNYQHKNLSENADLIFHKVGINGSVFLRPIRADLFVEPAFQSLNGNDNFGLTVGLGRFFLRNSRIDLSTGYFNDYWTYSIRAQHLFNRRFALQMSYERIDRFDFLNVGVRYTISERWR